MPNKITFFPTALPDEHIFSTVVRWYLLHKHETLENLLFLISNKNLNLNPSYAYTPFYKSIFDIFGGKFEQELFLRHTLIRYYQTFTHQNISKALTEGSGDKIFPFQQSKMLVARHWRWCSDCTGEDIENHGTTFWHVSHQLPTVIHCDKHSKRLIHGCTCGLFSDSFKNLKLPPTDNYCPNCKSEFDGNPIQNKIISWLDTISYKLINSDSNCKILRIKNKFMEKLLLTELQPNTMAYNKKMRVAQNAFNQFLKNNNIEESFFIDRRRINPKAENSKIGRFIHSNEFQLPIFYLLLMKFLIDDDEEIEKTLFGREGPEYDQCTENCIIL